MTHHVVRDIEAGERLASRLLSMLTPQEFLVGFVGLSVLFYGTALVILFFQTLFDNLYAAFSLGAFLAVLGAHWKFARVLSREGYAPRTARRAVAGCLLVVAILAELVSGAIGSTVARVTTHNPMTALYDLTGIAVGPIAGEAAKDPDYAKVGHAACIAARDEGRLASGRAQDQTLAYGCRYVIGPAHLSAYCPARFPQAMSGRVQSYYGDMPWRDTPCMWYLPSPTFVR